jgi:hypothetical protein
MARERKIILIGEQREDIDVRAIARVLIRLARHWQREADKAAQAEQRKDET